MKRHTPNLIAAFLSVFAACWSPNALAQGYADVVGQTQPKIVKIFGAGGLSGLESYQSGFLVSPEGHIVTAWSYVLDPDFTSVVLDDGRRFEAAPVGHDPRLEIAVLKIDASELEFFDLDNSEDFKPNTHILAFSNLYGVATGNEPVSVQLGIISAVAQLNARRGTFQTPYQGKAYVLDAMTNNAGAAGGALTDRNGRFGGLLGKELRNAFNNTWLNYALPASEIRASVKSIVDGESIPATDEHAGAAAEPITLDQLGIVLIHDVLFNTPPFVHRVRPGSPAERAGIQIDDLILFVDSTIVRSCKSVTDYLSKIDRDDPVPMILQRNNELIDVTLDD